MKTFSLIIITLSFSLFGINAVSAGVDENSQQRCSSLPFSLEGTPLTGKYGSGDPSIEYKGKLLDGITHIFYPSGKLQRRIKRVDDNGNPDIRGNRAIGIAESFNEECYLERKDVYENGKNSFSEWYADGILDMTGSWKDGKQQGDWKVYDKSGTVTTIDHYEQGNRLTQEYFKNEVITQRNRLKNGTRVSVEMFGNGNLEYKAEGPGWDENGKQTGAWEFYDKSGTVTAIDYYEQGNVLTKETFKNEVIIQRNRLKNGTTVSVEIFENGNLKNKTEGPGWDKNGNQTGVWEFYENGTLASKTTWKDSKVIKTVNIYPSVTCGKLVSDFGANEMRALRDHKNKTYIVTGRVKSVGADFMDNAQITLSDGAQYSFNSCIASPAKGEDFYYDLNEGQLVKMQCTIKGEIMGSPTLEKCVLAN